MFNKILIANRGEIAIRIMRACRELGIKTVAVYSTADKFALHAQIADEAVCIGPAQSKDSYLNTKAIIAACEATSANAIHPGFGFLSENADFARLCEKCGITFIGPPPQVMDEMGDKANARRTMIEAGVPVIPGSDGIVNTLEEAYEVCDKIGYPVMVKATAGGGGRGIRLVENKNALESNFLSASAEAEACFGNGGLYIEKFVVDPRHIEVQLLADNYGNVVHLGERDCSLQRRNQKVLEESPSPIMTDDLRRRMGEAAVSAARVSGYKNAGTIEFLVDKDKNFYFMEMNTRIQVEHPVTEFVTGIDLVKAQIRIAAGEKLWFTQDDVKISGHAIECRVNAENPLRNFQPCPGLVRSIHAPGGFNVRIDSAVYAGYEIPPFYDSMIAKLIVKGQDREEAIMKARVALAEFVIDGVETNIDFQLALLKNDNFVRGDFDNGFLNRVDIMKE
ncbi:MAG: acetyl-CoA carboxylase biotin carboxylase subunit [Oscillospiraceae bacterium]|nr:acetyl-CoA carboxylase biotin carboxylase subunit [Oscillospiraceae bacterium]